MLVFIPPYKPAEDDRVWYAEDIECFFGNTDWYSDLRYATQEEFDEMRKNCGGVIFQVDDKRKIFDIYDPDDASAANKKIKNNKRTYKN